MGASLTVPGGQNGTISLSVQGQQGQPTSFTGAYVGVCIISGVHIVWMMGTEKKKNRYDSFVSRELNHQSFFFSLIF
jgi:hypothetical protein